MYQIRAHAPCDQPAVGALIADTYGDFNLAATSAEARRTLLGPFVHARSGAAEHRVSIAAALGAPLVLVADDGDELVGVLRGGRTDGRGRTVLSSLFVAADHQRRGIGRRLVERFEDKYIASGSRVFKVRSSEIAVPFYSALGYKRTTGLRHMRKGAASLPYQPMKKVVA